MRYLAFALVLVGVARSLEIPPMPLARAEDVLE